MISDKHFADWENSAFGYGYGTGEDFIISALYNFMADVPLEGSYDHRKLEGCVGHIACWLLINLLCHQDMIEYGTSPRYGWLTEKGKALKEYLEAKGPNKAKEVISDHKEYCYPDHCNCEQPCNNPLWGKGGPNAL